MSGVGNVRYFIFGHMDLSQADFDQYYKDKISQAAEDKHSCFVVGSAPGADSMALALLTKLCSPQDLYRITVYHKGDAPETSVDTRIQTVGGFKTHDEKDSAMTRASDIDIAYLRSVDESRKLYGEKYDPTKKSSTQKNLERRLNQK
jgi:hypothetical protein